VSRSLHDASESDDLGFRCRTRKNGDIDILHRGRLAATLRGDEAVVFRAEVDDQGSAEAQQLMARVTGNYKRGNERLASQHPRNRR
jgi:cytochrome c-type biogenesis protein CcmE